MIRRRLDSRLLVVSAWTLALVVSSPASAQPANNQFFRTNPEMLAALTEVVAKPSSFTVRIKVQEKDAALGTIIGPDGWIITKASEIKGPAKVHLRDSRVFDARVIGVHNPTDLAMLKIDATGLPVPEWRDSKDAAVGSWLATVGIVKEPVAVGVVSVGPRPVPKDPSVFPANAGYLGIQMVPDETGVKVELVQPGTAAAKAGIKAGDVIVGLDDVDVQSREQLQQLLASRKAGQAVAVRLMRDGAKLELKATLGKRPVDRGTMQNNMGSVLSDRRSDFPMVLQHDTVLKPTDCGGPLVDLDGKVVGINIARAGRTESYALPSETVQTVLLDLMSGKLAPPPSSRPKSAAERLTEAEAKKALALATKSNAEKEVREAESAIQKAKQELEAEKKAEADKKKEEETKKKVDAEKKKDEKKPE